MRVENDRHMHLASARRERDLMNEALTAICRKEQAMYITTYKV